MIGKALATTGLIALALLVPGSTRAQLPDAPSAVEFGAGSSRAYDLNSQLGDLRAVDFDPARHSPGRIPQFMASIIGEAPQGQQSLYTPRKQTTPGPQLSSSSSSSRPVPGQSPQLRNACPQSSCSPAQAIMCCGRVPSPFARYLKNPLAVPMTSHDNLRSAVKDIIDPFNLLTIVGDSAFGIGTDSHTPYGPGVRGISKYAGVSVTEDMTGEFFGTYLVPSLVHQDPHYHREPFMPIPHRILHAITQILWTQSYTGKPMFNYANVFGGIATAVVSNTFVPGPGRQGWANTAQRLSVAFATSPSGNLITEFVPDLASHINLRVVIFQRILNTVSNEEGGGP
ncbi:MAG TPA: hypothetical protein VFN53_04985 [Acidobacteriaceae bacterium]|nr:hypothetical protein [Acidobacteriaceae bacterium]